MDKSALLYRGGVKSVQRKLVDGELHTLFYKARTPEELAAYFGAQQTFKEDEKGAVERQKHRAKFISESLVNEDGSPLLTYEEARGIPGTLKVEIVSFIIAGSNGELEEAKNA